jgi:hypothetical protein
MRLAMKELLSLSLPFAVAVIEELSPAMMMPQVRFEEVFYARNRKKILSRLSHAVQAGHAGHNVAINHRDKERSNNST